MAHRLQFAGVIILLRGAGDVREYAQIGIEHGEEAATLAILRPVVREMRNVEASIVQTYLTWIASRQIGL
jgi:hypothetical protein